MRKEMKIIHSKSALTQFAKKCFNNGMSPSEAGNAINEKWGLNPGESFLLQGGDLANIKGSFYMPVYVYSSFEFATFVKSGDFPLVSKMIGIGCRKKGAGLYKIAEIETTGKSVKDKFFEALEKVEGISFKKEKKKPVKRKDRFTIEGYYENHKRKVIDNRLVIIRNDWNGKPILNICNDSDEYYLADNKGRVKFLDGCDDVVDAVISYLNNQYPKGLEDCEAFGILDGVPKSISGRIDVEDKSASIGNNCVYFERKL